MEWQIVVILAITIPVLLIPVVYVWYLNIGGIYATIRQRRESRLRSRKMVASVSHAENKH